MLLANLEALTIAEAVENEKTAFADAEAAEMWEPPSPKLRRLKVEVTGVEPVTFTNAFGTL